MNVEKSVSSCLGYVIQFSFGVENCMSVKWMWYLLCDITNIYFKVKMCNLVRW